MFQMDNLHVTLCGLIDKYHNQELKFEESRFEIFCPVSVVWNNCSLFLPRFKNIFLAVFQAFAYWFLVYFKNPLLQVFPTFVNRVPLNGLKYFCVPPKTSRDVFVYRQIRLYQQFYGFWVFVLPDFCLKTFPRTT